MKALRVLALTVVLLPVHAVVGARAGAQDQTAAQALGASTNAEIRVELPTSLTPTQTTGSVKILVLLTLLSLAPALLISVTSFTRIVIVLSFVKQALGTQSAPPTQVLLALALMLTGVVMAPVVQRIDAEAVTPYESGALNEEGAWKAGSAVLRGFLLRQTRQDDLMLFHDLAHAQAPATQEDVSLHLLIPAFLISELRTGFEMGFLLFLPFVLVDLVVGTVLTAMGMVMMPPTVVSTPLKILLFVLVDGWAMLAKSLVASYG